MSPSATLAELVRAEADALDDGDWVWVHLFQQWRVQCEEQGLLPGRCLWTDCATFLPPGYADAFCSADCEAQYRAWAERRRPLEAVAA